MKLPAPGTTSESGRSAAVMILMCALLALLAPAATAQSATNFNTKKITPAARKAKTAEPKPPSQKPKDAAPANSMPSRYVGESDMDAYLESISAVFSIRGRTTDPFGQFQDPDAKPIVKTSVAKTTRRTTVAQVIPFQDIINLIKVNTVMPGEKRFLIGTRSFRQGDRMQISFRMKNITTEVVGVSARRIDFRNAESGETASLKMDLLPVGMMPGTSGISAPGMVREQANSPIELDSPMTPDESNPNQ